MRSVAASFSVQLLDVNDNIPAFTEIVSIRIKVWWT